ncbi:MAG: hypothetical protein IT405_00870 [Candidatus Yanofskybacteria bacterium]|nr:hypothetical protein [Candidatus Yanofskybacteria bacterium]
MSIVVGCHSADEFFRETLADAMRRERVRVSALVEFYLTALLARQMVQDARTDLPLGVRFVEALRVSSGSPERGRMLREVGDHALTRFVWWQVECSRRSSGSFTLYRHVGQRAYLYCGAYPFNELGERFAKLSDVMARCGTVLATMRPADVLQLYTLWTETRSEYAARAITELGLFFGVSEGAPS